MEDGQGFLHRGRPRWGLVALIIGLHALAIAGLIRAFAPDLAGSVIEQARSLVTVNVTPPAEPEVEPSPDPSPQPDEGAAGEVGEEAVPREIAAPLPPIELPSPSPVPRTPSTGIADDAGAREEGDGTGAGGPGDGTGSGGEGTGQGGLPVTRPVKIAGDINNAADYPTPPGGREIRRGHSVTVYMTVTPEGRAEDCRVVEPSPDPVADRITCELAEERFRFRPARNAAGDPVPATYGWRQRWF